MRKILFSGKRMDNGEWVEGSLLRFTDGSAMIMPSNSMAYVPKGKNVFCSAECYEIDTETVGEYTGEKDKNGVKVFEHHIVKTKSGIGVINFDNGCFSVQDNHSRNNPALDIVMNEGEIEVIGNVFDNPDFLDMNKSFLYTEKTDSVNISTEDYYIKNRYACGCPIVPGCIRCPNCGASY